MLPLPARDLEMEPDRAPDVQLHHHELAGAALTSLRTIIELISATATTTGLTIQAGYDPNPYPKGVRISDAQLAAVPLHPPRLARRVELHNCR